LAEKILNTFNLFINNRTKKSKIKMLLKNKNIIAKLILYFILVFLLLATLSKIHRQEIIVTDIFTSFRKESGARTLPIQIQAMKKIVLRQNLSDVRLDSHLYENTLIHQRAVEYLYPIRIDQKSTFTFTDQTSLVGQRCKLVDKEDDIELFQC